MLLDPGSALDGDEVWSLTRLATIQAGPPRRPAVWQSGTKGEPPQGPMGGSANQGAQLPPPRHVQTLDQPFIPKNHPGRALTHALLYRTVTLTANLWVSPFTAESHEGGGTDGYMNRRAVFRTEHTPGPRGSEEDI